MDHSTNPTSGAAAPSGDGMSTGEQMQTKLQSTQEQLKDSLKTIAALQRAQQKETEAALKQTNTELEQTKTELEQTKTELKQQQAITSTEEMIRKITANAKPVDSENRQDKQRRALRVMAELKKLCAFFTQFIVEDGKLDLGSEIGEYCDVLTTTNLMDLAFWLPSGSSEITSLNLMHNDGVFQNDDAALTLSIVVSSMRKLLEINLDSSRLSNTGFKHLVDNLSRGCPNLTTLKIDFGNITDTGACEKTLERILTRLPHLKIQVTWVPWTLSSWVGELVTKFPGKILN